MQFNEHRTHQLILVFKETPAWNVISAQELDLATADSIESKIRNIFQQEEVVAKPLFATAPEGLMAFKETIVQNKYNKRLLEMDKFYHLRSVSMESLEKVKNRLQELGVLHTAYYK